MENWSDVIDAATRHAVLPLTLTGLAGAAPIVRPSIPADVIDEFRRRFDQNALRNIEVAHYLLRLADRLAERGIAFMPIKGPILAISAYRDLALRQFGDLDLVIHRRDLQPVRAILRADGFQPTNAVPGSLDQLLIGTDYHLPLSSTALGISLEIHWALGRRGFGSLRREDWAWTNAVNLTLMGRSLPTMDWEAQIVYLCAHGAKHNWSQLARVCDVYAVIRVARDLDWDRVRSIATRAGVSRMVGVGIGLCEVLLGAEVAARARLGESDPAARALIEEAKQRFLAERKLSPGEELRLQLRVRDRMVDRLLFAADVLASPHVSDVNAVALPAGMRPLYYLARPLRLAAKRARSLIGR